MSTSERNDRPGLGQHIFGLGEMPCPKKPHSACRGEFWTRSTPLRAFANTPRPWPVSRAPHGAAQCARRSARGAPQEPSRPGRAPAWMPMRRVQGRSARSNRTKVPAGTSCSASGSRRRGLRCARTSDAPASAGRCAARFARSIAHRRVEQGCVPPPDGERKPSPRRTAPGRQRCAVRRTAAKPWRCPSWT